VNVDTAHAEDWVPFYEALLRRRKLDTLDALQDFGYFFGEHNKVMALHRRALAAGLDDAKITVDGFFLYQTRRGLPFNGTEWRRLWALFGDESERRLRDLGHRAVMVEGRGFRFAYCCGICGNRLYVDTERGVTLGELADPRPCPGAAAKTEETCVLVTDDWVLLYEALVCIGELDELREGGSIDFGWDRLRANRLLAEARRAGLDVHAGFYADTGYYNFLSGFNPFSPPRPRLHSRCWELVHKHEDRAEARGHIPHRGRVVGARAALFCASCGGRLYIDAERDLVCGELVKRRRCLRGEKR
jgi:hypothetical protein